MSSDEWLHALCRVRLIRNHHHPISVHVHGAQATLSVTDQAEHGFVKVLVLLLCTQTQTFRSQLQITSFHVLQNCKRSWHFFKKTPVLINIFGIRWLIVTNPTELNSQLWSLFSSLVWFNAPHDYFKIWPEQISLTSIWQLLPAKKNPQKTYHLLKNKWQWDKVRKWLDNIVDHLVAKDPDILVGSWWKPKSEPNIGLTFNKRTKTGI